ncbi:hypothetical protein BLNAU_10081 [Blattamonas nauphoetae]|uniref:Uncharacterized protein n=1 Tax=Blattamonas nauphoetae TaxID=2049346 RepID=A0ABQ9XTY7_9EUKA|nr:hypothetical protein BLNAU_10081 [Blattamonas nauphoetae]
MEIDKKTDSSSDTTHSDLFTSPFSFSLDCSPFLNWDEEELESEKEKAVVYRSLVATVKSQPTFDIFLEAKAVEFLESVDRKDDESADVFLTSHGRTTDESLTNFVRSIGVLISSASQDITSATMEMLLKLIWSCSENVRLDLVEADLIPQLINTLNPQSLSFAEAFDIHSNLMKSLTHCFWLVTPNGLSRIGIEDDDGLQAVHKTVLQQVVVHSEKYICHLCVNRCSIIYRELSMDFLNLLATLLRICASHEPTMEFVLHMPVILTIPSCLTFFENDNSIYWFLLYMNTIQWEWNKTRGVVRQMWKKVHRMLRMEGFEDVFEEKLLNDEHENNGRYLVADTIKLSNKLGMNL